MRSIKTRSMCYARQTFHCLSICFLGGSFERHSCRFNIVLHIWTLIHFSCAGVWSSSGWKCVRGYFTSHFMHFVGVSSGFRVLRGLRCYPPPLRRTMCRHIWTNTVLVFCWKPSLMLHMTNATITNYIYTLLWKLSWDQIMWAKSGKSFRKRNKLNMHLKQLKI